MDLDIGHDARSWIWKRTGWLIVVACVVTFGAACGDEELEGDNDPDPETNQNQNQEPENQNQNQNQGEEGCEDDETYNPITGECVPADDENQNQNDPNQGATCADVDCDEGLVCDPDTGDCVECVGDGHCDEGDVCDTDTNECIEDEPTPEECTSDDDCDDGEECNTETGQCEADEFQCGPGGIIGETCTADDGVLPGATVIVEGYDCDGVSFTMQETAGNDGAYEFTDVPAGTHTLTIKSGSFEISDDVSVQNGEITDRESVGEKLCFVGTEVDIAVAIGGFDDIAAILDNMNIDYDTISSNSSFFGDLDQMRDYDIIFAECGTSSMGLGGSGFDADSDEVAYNIRRYVEEGHSLYASDWSSRFIRYTIPDAMEFSDQTGGAPQTVMAEVVSDEMFLLLESDTAEVHFNAGGWHMMEGVGPASQVQFRGDVDEADDIPFMAIYDDPIGGGRAIYTSFHNNNQATGDMEDILEFMIFQL